MNQQPEIRSLAELSNLLIKAFRTSRESLYGRPLTCWPIFSESFGGTRPGELITVTGETGSGKSSLTLNWALNAARNGISALLVSLEERWEATAIRLASMTAKKPFKDFDPTDMGGIIEIWPGIKLWYLDVHGPQKDDYLLETIRVAKETLGIQLVVIDHLDYVEKTFRPNEGESYTIGHFLRRLCGTIHKHEVTAILVAHPKKLEVRGIGAREVGMDELKGSSSIKQESDAVISIYQPNRERNETILRFQKIRHPTYSRNTMGYLRFMFNSKTLWLEELSTAVEWGVPK